MTRFSRILSLLHVLWLAACPALTPGTGPSDPGTSSIGVVGAPSAASKEETGDAAGNPATDAAGVDDSLPGSSAIPTGAEPTYRSLPGSGRGEAANQTPPIAVGVIAPEAIPGDTTLTVIATINSCLVERDPSRLSVEFSGSAAAPAETVDANSGKATSWKKIPFLRIVITPAKGAAQCADVALPDPDPTTGRQDFSTTLLIPSPGEWDFYLSPAGVALITPLPMADPYTGLANCPENATWNLEKPTNFGLTKKDAPILDKVKSGLPCSPHAQPSEELQLPDGFQERMEIIRRNFLVK